MTDAGNSGLPLQLLQRVLSTRRRRAIGASVLAAGLLSAAALGLHTETDSASQPVVLAKTEIESAQPSPARAPDGPAAAPGVSAEGILDEPASEDRAPRTEPNEPPARGHRTSTRKGVQTHKAAARHVATGVKTPGTRGSLLSGLPTLQTPSPSAGTGASAAATGPGLEAMAIQRTVRKYSPGVRQDCWQPALNARGSSVPSSAKVTATITVDASGRVQAVTASGAPSGYPGLARCIEQAVRGWTFPRSRGETTTRVPFVFVGQ